MDVDGDVGLEWPVLCLWRTAVVEVVAETRDQQRQTLHRLEQRRHVRRLHNEMHTYSLLYTRSYPVPVLLPVPSPVAVAPNPSPIHRGCH